ncbi:uncharacterized protein JCM15063_002789 [Sporobolomyces koalae]|uniref:uncharacterized protein n=1 Tax=Sporobolomyces koalae TaxID=500713 RepID=UPI0031711319
MDRQLDHSDVDWVFVGTVLSSEVDRSLSILVDQVLVVNKQGYIVHLESSETLDSLEYLRLAQQSGFPHERLMRLGPDAWILPGFVDTHIHAPQYVNAGMALDKPLMEWLEAYTFKAEARIDRDPDGYGKRVYGRLVERMIENGTTAASVFGTISVEANLVLARTFLNAGLRGQIGKVAMDQNSPATYIETTEQSLAETRRFIELTRQLVETSKPRHLQTVEPVITPRFVPTCTNKLLSGLKMLADETRVRVQSHLAESRGEVELCKHLLGGQTDVELFHELGLLGPKALMAHCTHANDTDLALFAQTGTAIAHCPLSNVYFSSERQLALREAWNAQVKVGLGSDISGGYRVGLDENMRWSVGISRLRQGTRQEDDQEPEERESLAISWKESMYLATLGGAQALGLDETNRVGQLKVGQAFDAQLIRVRTKGSRVDWFEREDGSEITIEEKVEKWWCNGSEVDRKAVWVQGQKIM